MLQKIIRNVILKDLEFLKHFGGPITTVDEVQHYVDTVKGTPTINNCLYVTHFTLIQYFV